VGTVTVRSARDADLPRIVELLEFGALVEGKEDGADGAAYASALDEIRATPGCDVLVAEAAGEVVGTCQLIVFRHLQARGGRCAEVESMHVHPDHRSRGIGAQLLAAAVEAARQEGCYRVQLTSDRQRQDAHRFYEREGMTASHVGFKLLLGPT
jgi:GNAT superfamily N-acetyltransferase